MTATRNRACVTELSYGPHSPHRFAYCWLAEYCNCVARRSYSRARRPGSVPSNGAQQGGRYAAYVLGHNARHSDYFEIVNSSPWRVRLPRCSQQGISPDWRPPQDTIFIFVRLQVGDLQGGEVPCSLQSSLDGFHIRKPLAAT